MSKDQIKILQNYSEQILLSEIGALIHDIGKLNKFFVEKKSSEHLNGDYHHANILEYESKQNSKFFVSESLGKKAKTLENILKNEKVYYNSQSKGDKSDLYSFLECHHKPNNNFTKLLKASDSFDSDEDRGNASDEQSISATYQSNAFGFERNVDLSIYETERNKIYGLVINLLNNFDGVTIKEKRTKFLKKLEESSNKVLGMTARAANDVTLWEHSYMTASIMKTLFAESILSKTFPIAESKEKIQENKYFRILSIGWDYFDFLTQSQKISDIMGREEALNKVKSSIKNKIEVKYLLGNCIYEDNSSVHFLIPKSFKEEDKIKTEIYEIFNEYKIFNEKLDGIIIPCILFSEEGTSLVELMPQSIKNLKEEIKSKKIPKGFKPNWVKSWRNNPKKKLICSNCNKGFYTENDLEKICKNCLDLRKIGRKEKFPQTRFIDEIAWNKSKYENVALFVLNFDLKDWLNGKYVKSLFINRYDEKELFELKGFYNSGICTNLDKSKFKIEINKFLDLGPITGLNEQLKAYDAALNRLNSCINEIDSSNNFVKTEFKNIKISLEKTKEELKNKNINSVKKIFKEELNKNKIEKYLKNKFSAKELQLLGEERISDKRKIVKDLSINEIIEKIFLKNPSPSRLMRVWHSTEDFFNGLEKEICQSVPSIKRYVLEGVKKADPTGKAWEIKLSFNNKEIEVTGEAIFEDGKCTTITPHLNPFIEKYNSNKFDVKLIDKETEKYEIFHGVQCKNVRFPKAYRIITVSPDQFMFMAPASSSLKILDTIKREYEQVFGKVFGKLPLNVGVVYFQRKTPLFSVLDSARRFAKTFEEENNLFTNETDIPSFEVKEVTADELIFDNGYRIEKRSKLGNCEMDYYHPYLLVEKSDDEDVIEIKTINGVISQKHVESIKKGDKIKIHPSFFDFEFLDTNVRRFDITLGEKGGTWKKREHPIVGENGPKPYFLGDLNKFKRLKKIFEEIGSWTPIWDLASLIIAKQDWKEIGDSDIYKNFVDSALENKIGSKFSGSSENKEKWKSDVKPFLAKCIHEGSFFDAVELYKTILKLDLKVGK